MWNHSNSELGMRNADLNKVKYLILYLKPCALVREFGVKTET